MAGAGDPQAGRVRHGQGKRGGRAARGGGKGPSSAQWKKKSYFLSGYNQWVIINSL
jgi:hypothetical protein